VEDEEDKELEEDIVMGVGSPINVWWKKSTLVIRIVKLKVKPIRLPVDAAIMVNYGRRPIVNVK
jgi:hypothetical protein